MNVGDRRPAWTAAAVILLVAFASLVVLPAARNPHTNGFAAYYTAARLLLFDRAELPRVYDNAWFQSRIDAFGFDHVHDIFNVQPPTMTLLMAPLAWMSPGAARAVWIFLSAALWCLACLLLARLVRPAGAALPPRVWFPLATVLYFPLRENFRRGQCYLLLLALLVAHLALLVRPGRRAAWLAGVPLGLMVILKATGLWLWPLLLLARRWRTLAGGAATALGVAAAWTAGAGVGPWLSYLHEIPAFMASPSRFLSPYQTVGSLIGHLLVYSSAYNPRPVANLPALARALTVAATLLALVQSARWRVLDEGESAERLLGVAMLAALVVTMAPVAENYHYLLVFPSLLVGWWWAIEARLPRAARLALAVSSLLLVVPQKLYFAPGIQAGWRALLAYPRVYGAVLLWAWLGTTGARLRAARRDAG